MRFDTLLIANRGEIACRVIRSARAAGLRTVAVYSEADRRARHVVLADTAVPIGPAEAAESYLSIERILAACAQSGAGAVHPGYGFLSENAAFSLACRTAGVVFVGPSPEAIEALGNKAAAKAIAERVGVPCLPGFSGRHASLDELAARAREIGTPLMIKAAAGGGGRGMRRVDDIAELAPQLAAAAAEAAAAFGSGELLLERLVEHARHVEVQVLGDEFGNYLHLGERDCSTQRRNQKILEEAPAPGVDGGLRDRLGEAAVALAQVVGYVGAGTVEFLLAPDGAFYFLEMNTRLQVEHPVTEAITGLDLVSLQLAVAQGHALPLRQADVRLSGHAIEARLCAENAFDGFVPQSGRIAGWSFPGEGVVRVDHGLADEAEVPRHYDSMIAKLVVHADDRDAARRRLVAALADTHVHGLTTNRDFLVRCLEHPAFATPALATRWLEDALAEGWRAPPLPAEWLALAAALLVRGAAAAHGALGLWSSTGMRESPLRLSVERAGAPDDEKALREVRVQVHAGRIVVVVDGTPREVDFVEPDKVRIGPVTRRFSAARLDHARWSLDFAGVMASFEDASAKPPLAEASASSGDIVATMHGQVVSLDPSLRPGAHVRRGQRLVSIEAMKMEHRLTAPFDGVVAELRAEIGRQVQPGAVLLRITRDAASPPSGPGNVLAGGSGPDA